MKRMMAVLFGVVVVGAIGYLYNPASSSTQVAEITVPDMMCENCVAHVTEALTALQGVEKAEVSLETKVARVVYNSEKLNEEALLEAIHKAGYGKSDANKESCEEEKEGAEGCCSEEGHKQTKT